MQQKTQQRLEPRLEPWSGERTSRTSADAFFAPPHSAKSHHAMANPASKLGSILVLLAISSVAAVGVLMPEEPDYDTSPAQVNSQGNSQVTSRAVSTESISPPRLAPRTAPPTGNAPTGNALTGNALTGNAPTGNEAQQAYAIASDLARQRVTTVAGLTRQERIQTAREAVARVVEGDISHLDAAAITALARLAPEPVKNAAFQGVRSGEAKGISEQSHLVVNRLLERERQPNH